MRLLSSLILPVAAFLTTAPHRGESYSRVENPSYIASRCDEAVNPEVASVTVEAGGKKFVYTDAPITPSDFTVAEEIESRRINAPLAQKIELTDNCLHRGADYKTALSVCFPLLSRFVDEIAEYVNVAPKNAEVKYANGKFRVTEDATGIALDEARLYAGIYFGFKFMGAGNTVKANTVVVKPDVTAAELRANLTPRGEYATDYRSSNPSRAHNVSLALSKLDGAVIAAGEKLSFNATVGDRTEDNGFRKAKIIVDGQYTDGVGGGVCQASTALYNAAILSGLNAAANAHSICPSYCPPGLDAMISSMSDLVITNTTAHPVYISVSIGSGTATVRIFGEPQDYTVVPESVVLESIPRGENEVVDSEYKYFERDTASGDRVLVTSGRDGVISETYLNYYRNGVMFKRVKIRSNEYKPTPRVIAVAP